MKSRIMILAIAVVAVGVIAMPATLSLLSGQHTFYGGSDYSKNVKCEKCHNNIKTEFYLSGGSAPHFSGFFTDTCRGCHASGNISAVIMAGDPTQFGISELKNQNLSGGHVAVTVPCTFCHDLVPPQLNSSSAAHKPLYSEALNETLLKGGNEACIVCHTAAGAGTLNASTEKLIVNYTQDASYNYIVSYELG